MELRGRDMLHTIFLAAIIASAQSRAVNISNTWVLPEEGFPVFYRYFRDHISWYEADAVCQFHHANLVTVDTTAQYDALRAYLKELDISSAVWVGLIRSNPDGDFTWTDYRGLSSDGYWSAAPDARAAPLCAAANPAADYRWEARACGGPTVASFICELPVPQWALGNEGCMVRALPALTVLYLPESAAVQLTADCGLAGVKKVQCTGNVKREDLLKDLSCVEEIEQTSSPSIISTVSVSSEPTYTDLDVANETSAEDFTTIMENDNTQQVIQTTTPHSFDDSSSIQLKENVKTQNLINNLNTIYLEKNVNFLQGNDIPKTSIDINFLTDEKSKNLVDEQQSVQQQVKHEEFTKLGIHENIYTQPTDHFVPPLVMARAKISEDMTVLSLDEKHAQQFAEHFNKQNRGNLNNVIVVTEHSNLETPATTQIIDYVQKDKKKQASPKKYIEKLNDPKSKLSKLNENKMKSEKITFTTHNIETELTTFPTKKVEEIEEVPSIDLTVIIKEPGKDNLEKIFYSNLSTSIAKTEDISISTGFPLLDVTETLEEKTTPSTKTTTEVSLLKPTERQSNETVHEIVQITIINNDSNGSTKSFEFTTKTPVMNSTRDTIQSITTTNLESVITADSAKIVDTSEDQAKLTHIVAKSEKIEFSTTNKPSLKVTNTVETASSEIPSISVSSVSSNNRTSEHISTYEPSTTHESIQVSNEERIDIFNYTGSFSQEEDHEHSDIEPINDADSPLLSAANQPLHRPNRSRRPIQPNRISKFNPFRMLG